jgi:hypothetical protein
MTSPGSDLRARAVARVRLRQDFWIHLFLYLAVSGLLWVLWALTGANLGDPWPLWAMLGWGVVLGAHWYAAFGRREGRHEAEIEEELRGRPRG